MQHHLKKKEVELSGSPSSSEQQLSPPYFLAGVDEAGRGPLAGPVVAASVILSHTNQIYGLRDSKIVPEEQREALYFSILDDCVSYSISVIEPPVIDELNIFAATMKAMRQAIHGLERHPNLVLVDGNQKPQSEFPERPLVRGDGMSASIMAASILAKVTRDQIMVNLHEQYPQYGFDKNKGYGSASHLKAIRDHGPCPLHRRSFEPIKSLGKQHAEYLY